MSDLISRNAAIEAIDKNRQDLLSLGMGGAEHILVHYGRRVIEELPTINPVKRGKWEKTYLDHEGIGERPSIFYCSVCNQCIAYPVNYCPSCGADMRGEEDENNNQI